MMRRSRILIRQSRSGFLLSLPAIILMLVIYILPIAVLMALSFSDYEMGAIQFSFIGLKNYIHAIVDPVFRRALINTAWYVAIVVPMSVFGGLFVAMMVQGQKKFRSFYEVIFFLPVTSTLIAMATVWQFLFHPSLGPINLLLKALGIDAKNFLGDPALMIPALAGIGIWQLLGFNMIIFLTGLSKIPQDIKDAAALDGIRSPVERFLRITWPLLSPTTLFVLVTTSITAFKIFDTVAVLTQGRNGSEVILYDIYLEGFTYSRMGYACALTTLFLVAILLLSSFQVQTMERKTHYQ